MGNMSLMFLAPVRLCATLVFDMMARRCDEPKWCVHWSVSFPTLPLHATASTNYITQWLFTPVRCRAERPCLSLHQFPARECVSAGVCQGGTHHSRSPPPAALTRKAFELISVKQGKQRRCGKGLPKWDQVRDRGVGGCHFHSQLLHIQQGEQGTAGQEWRARPGVYNEITWKYRWQEVMYKDWLWEGGWTAAGWSHLFLVIIINALLIHIYVYICIGANSGGMGSGDLGLRKEIERIVKAQG